MQDKRYQPGFPTLLALVAIFAAALWVRLSGVAWDEFASLHPDERFLLFVATDMARGLEEALGRGASVSDIWFATGASPLDPRLGGRSYVYGEAPAIVLALLLRALEIGDWVEALRVGRTLTAAIDAFTALAVAILAFELWRSAAAALLAAALYAAAPTALQLANFFTVDAWLTAAFAWCGALLAILGRTRGGAGSVAVALGAGAVMGLALACKLPGLLLGAAAPVALVLLARRSGGRAVFASTAAFAIGAAVAFRLSNPFAFAGPDVWDVAPSDAFLQDVGGALDRSLSWGFPPDWQWLAGYSLLELLRDFALFGAGPAMLAAAIIGTAAVLKCEPGRALLALALALPVMAVTAASETPALRYAAPAIPALAALGGFAVTGTGRFASAAFALLAAWWGDGVVALHTQEHPRLAASRWLWTLPAGTVLANETAWDEGLPVPVMLERGGERIWPGHAGHFRLETLDVTAEDNAEKAERMARLLASADYLVVSSGRQRQVMPRLPDRFPMTAAYYRMLADGTLCYTSVWRADPGYPAPLIRIDDSWAQEPWRVYDHPAVEIYRRQPCYDPEAARARLVAALQ